MLRVNLSKVVIPIIQKTDFSLYTLCTAITYGVPTGPCMYFLNRFVSVEGKPISSLYWFSSSLLYTLLLVFLQRACCLYASTISWATHYSVHYCIAQLLFPLVIQGAKLQNSFSSRVFPNNYDQSLFK